MSLKKTRAQDLDLSSLLQGIDDGEVVLPNFQRDFDWTDVEVRSLLGTILSGWPIGSLLLIEGTDEFYNPRPIESAPPIARDIALIVLDGQQRLTALYQALYSKGSLRYAISLQGDRDYGDIDVLDDALLDFKTVSWENLYSTPEAQWEARLLPISSLRSASDFFEWRDEAVPSDDSDGRAWLTEIYRRFLAGIHNYKVPAVIIHKDIEPAAVARIFERVNRMGMTLGAFDLVVARSFSTGFNLRVLWEEARRTHPILQRFLGEDGLPVLSVIALRQRESIRQSAVLDLPGSAIRDGWEEAVANYAAALDFAVRNLGVLHTDWVPYKPILTVLAGLNYDFPLVQNGALISRWYWCTVLGRRYDVASNTRAVADFTKLSTGEDPITRTPVLVRETMLESTRRQQGALHRAFLTAIGARVLQDQGLEDSAVDGELDLTAESLYVRSPESPLDPPIHLRTLSFVLASRSRGRFDVVSPSAQFIESGELDIDAEDLLDLRLARLATFASELAGSPIRLISEEEWELERSAGR
ncbi:GmrSD restriction endonuclease domain-containing protein [Cellulomonas septica]|uniref:DUF262 domain-containing protein n=1 Tax=Cellulomonas septica TaxID=285080 RepID=A0ABX1JV14_9CELL|nr:DUF262 domain-containing protein [Cellulomonas septica]NKY38139.1 DUF262 domain-containing protein [Cellulomonas septica]